MRNFEQTSRSTVRATQGMVATSHPLSTSAGLAVLQAGGNAIDAAVTACAVQAVVEPQSTGIGGDCFALIAPKGRGQIKGLNASGRAPSALSIDGLKAQGLSEIPRQSPHAVTIPGALAGWQAMLDDQGSWSLAQCLEPAINYAENGYVVTDRVHRDWKTQEALLIKDDYARQNLLIADEAPAVGTLMRHLELAATLKIISSKGVAAFYEGELADQMLSSLQSWGGLHSKQDFQNCRSAWVEPVSTHYNQHQVWQIPPNGQGMVALIMLNVLEGFENEALTPLSSVRLHREIEAARWAYAARDAYLGETCSEPLEWLVSKDYAAEIRAKIQDYEASPALPAIPNGLEHKDTVYITVVDKDRTSVSLINSIFHSFGSGLVCPSTGVVFQNRGQSFNLTPGHANALAGGKQPMHTIIPGMVTDKQGRVSHCYGVMGGQYQPFGHAHVLTNMFDFGLDPQAALDCPRLMADASKAVECEQGISSETRKQLTDIGHVCVDTPDPIGGGQVIEIDWDQGGLAAGSDPRKDGHAAGY